MILFRILKGFVIGSCMLIPGVSGGTMAIVMGIYDEMIVALSNITKKFKDNFFLLLQYLVGGLIGIFLLANPVLQLLNLWEYPVLYLFMGAIFASIFPLFKRVSVSRIKLSNVFVAILGMVIGIGTRYLPANFFTFSVIDSTIEFIALIGVGFLIAVALILPGISGSYILLMLGLYSLTLNAVDNFDLFFLSPIIIGAVIGTLLTTRFMAYMMKTHPQFTYMLIIGFILGSLVQIFPGLPAAGEAVMSCTTFLIGFLAVIGLSVFSKKL